MSERSPSPSPYPAVPSNPRFPEIEERVLAYWDQDGTFVASVENRDAGEDGKRRIARLVAPGKALPVAG